MNKKYRLTGDTIPHPFKEGIKLYRIQALVDIPRYLVIAGDIGGYVESEDNLSQLGACWIGSNAIVCDNATVFGNATVCDNARVGGNATVFGNATVCDNARVGGNAAIGRNAKVCNNAKVCDYATVFGNAKVCDNARVGGNAAIRGNANIQSSNDYLTIGPIGSRNSTLTVFVDNNGELVYTTGCFIGNEAQFIERLIVRHANSPIHLNTYLSAIEFSKLRFEFLNT